MTSRVQIPSYCLNKKEEERWQQDRITAQVAAGQGVAFIRLFTFARIKEIAHPIRGSVIVVGMVGLIIGHQSRMNLTSQKCPITRCRGLPGYGMHDSP